MFVLFLFPFFCCDLFLWIQAIGLDQLGVGIQFDNMGIDGFPPYVVMLYVDAVLYFLLAIYFDNVVPGMQIFHSIQTITFISILHEHFQIVHSQKKTLPP